MKPNRTKLICILLMVFYTTTVVQAQLYDIGKLYPVAELKADFQFLRNTFEKKHPNLYLYTPKQTFDNFFDSLYGNINQPMTEMGFYNLVTLLNAKIKNGHTMFLPSDGATAYFNKSCRFLPFYAKVVNNRLYVYMNCSADTTIHDGAEILAINSVSANNILNYLTARQVRDGYNTTYPVWILDNYFKEYYGFAFGHPSEFTVTFKNNNRKPCNTVVHALVKDSIRYYRYIKYPYTTANNKVNKGITLEINKPASTATLTVKTFDNDGLLSLYEQHFKTIIDSSFQQLTSSNIKNLILDLRDNQGGDFENGQLLLSYLLGKPFQLLLHGQATEVIQAAKNSFSGVLYTLINGGSFSNTAIVCSRLSFYKRGIFIGEETGGNNTVISGFDDETANITLPNTKINCAVANTVYVIRNDIKNTGHGTLPNYWVRQSLQGVFNNTDNAKAFAFKLIAANGKQPALKKTHSPLMPLLAYLTKTIVPFILMVSAFSVSKYSISQT